MIAFLSDRITKNQASTKVVKKLLLNFCVQKNKRYKKIEKRKESTKMERVCMNAGITDVIYFL
jgi:hypothetical protein